MQNLLKHIFQLKENCRAGLISTACVKAFSLWSLSVAMVTLQEESYTTFKKYHEVHGWLLKLLILMFGLSWKSLGKRDANQMRAACLRCGTAELVPPGPLGSHNQRMEIVSVLHLLRRADLRGKGVLLLRTLLQFRVGLPPFLNTIFDFRHKEVL